jgi:hypothetical protein
MSQAQSEVEYRKGLMTSAQSNFNTCTENLRNPNINKKVAASTVIVDNEVFFRKDDSPNKVTLMSSNAKITETQKKALLDLISASQECRNGIKQGLARNQRRSPRKAGGLIVFSFTYSLVFQTS